MLNDRKLRTFPCPACREIIDDGTNQCRFCGQEIDSEAAAVAAELQSKVNKACSDASFVEVAAIAMWVPLALSWLGSMYIFFWGFLALFVVMPVLIIRWQVVSGRMQTADTDYRKANRSWRIAVGLWLAAFVVEFAPILDEVISYRTAN